MLSRKEIAFGIGLLAGVSLLVPLGWLLTLVITGAVVGVGVLDELTQERARTVAVTQVVEFRLLLRERSLDVEGGALLLRRRSLEAASAPASR